jgi:hypothetical protein
VNEYPTLELETAIEDESVSVCLQKGGRVTISISQYDGEIDAFVVRTVEIRKPADLHELARRLLTHTEPHI